MLDDLLGRTPLKERIEELEEEIHHLERRLEAEQERRREAVSDRQEAQERTNRLEDRIADLEGQLSDARTDETADGPAFSHTVDLRGERLVAVLDRLASVETDPEGALTAGVPADGGLPTAVSDLLGHRAPLVRQIAPCLVCADDSGIVRVGLQPPGVPEPTVTWADGFRLDRDRFLPTGRFALALVRADLFAVGTYEDGGQVAFEGFESDVKGDHSKGGFSQGRFERARDEQIAEHVDRCRIVLEGVDTDRLYVTGDRRLVDEFAEMATTTATVDATGDPEPALDDAFQAFWTTRLYGL